MNKNNLWIKPVVIILLLALFSNLLYGCTKTDETAKSLEPIVEAVKLTRKINSGVLTASVHTVKQIDNGEEFPANPITSYTNITIEFINNNGNLTYLLKETDNNGSLINGEYNDGEIIRVYNPLVSAWENRPLSKFQPTFEKAPNIITTYFNGFNNSKLVTKVTKTAGSVNGYLIEMNPQELTISEQGNFVYQSVIYNYSIDDAGLVSRLAYYNSAQAITSSGIMIISTDMTVILNSANTIIKIDAPSL